MLAYLPDLIILCRSRSFVEAKDENVQLRYNGRPVHDMLIIRAKQTALLIAASEVHTEIRAMRHLKNCIAQSCALMTEAELLEIIRWGRRRSRHYGIEREYDFFRYLNLMFMFGVDFDTSPQYPWAARTLSSTGRASARVDLLMDHAMLACSRMERNRTTV